MSSTFPLVCAGGSAGSLDAFCLFLDHLPVDTGCAFVIVNHVRSSDQVFLPDILKRHTQMPVTVIAEGMEIQPNNIFVIPGRCDLKIRAEVFRLAPVSKPYGWPDVFTIFLRSASAQWEGTCVAVVFSGLAFDGVAALAEIRAAGGLTIAQAPETAGQKDMPENAIKSGQVDWILAPWEIGRQLTRITYASIKSDGCRANAKGPDFVFHAQPKLANPQ